MVSRPSSRSNSFHRQNSNSQLAGGSMLASEALKRMMASSPGSAPLNAFLPKVASKSGSQASQALVNMGKSLSKSSMSSSSGNLLMPLTPLVPLVPLTNKNKKTMMGPKSNSSGQLAPLVPLIGGRTASTASTMSSSTTSHNPASQALNQFLASSTTSNNVVISTPASDALDEYLKESNARSKKTKTHVTASPGSSSSLNKLLVHSNSTGSLKRKTSFSGSIGSIQSGTKKSLSFNGGLCNHGGGGDDNDSSHAGELPGMLPPWATLDDDDEDYTLQDLPPVEPAAGSVPPWANQPPMTWEQDHDDAQMCMPPPAPVSPQLPTKKVGTYDMTDLFNATQDDAAAGLEFPTIGASFPDDDDDDDHPVHTAHITTKSSLVLPTITSSSSRRSKSFNSLLHPPPQDSSHRKQLVRSKTLREIHRILSNHAMQDGGGAQVIEDDNDNVFDFRF